jgi:hypothetical protein
LANISSSGLNREKLVCGTDTGLRALLGKAPVGLVVILDGERAALGLRR